MVMTTMLAAWQKSREKLARFSPARLVHRKQKEVDSPIGLTSSKVFHPVTPGSGIGQILGFTSHLSINYPSIRAGLD